MTDVIATIKIMPDSPETDLSLVEEKAKQEIKNFGGEVGKVQIEPVAFGLKAINLIFAIDEENGALDPLEDKIKAIDGVVSAEVVDVRRALG